MASATVQRQLALNVRAFARARGIALNHLADRADVSRSQLYDVLAERKGATVDWLARIATALGVSPWQLIAPRSVLEQVGASPVGQR